MLVGISNGMQAVKLCSNKILQFLTHWLLRSLVVTLLGYTDQRALQYNRDIQYTESRL